MVRAAIYRSFWGSEVEGPSDTRYLPREPEHPPGSAGVTCAFLCSVSREGDRGRFAIHHLQELIE